jgi:simple sugar transport system permease protein
MKTKDRRTTPQKRPAGHGFWQRLGRAIGVPALALLTALIVSALFIVLSDMQVYQAFSRSIGEGFYEAGSSVGSAYLALLQGSFGNPVDVVRGIGNLISTGDAKLLKDALDPLSESLTTAAPYIFGGLAVALGFRCGLFNIGVEGQLFVGALASAYLGYSLVGLPVYIHLPLALLGGAVAGGLWGAIPGALKAWRGAHEVINTIMMNYIAFRLADYMLTGPMKRSGFNPISPPILDTAKLTRLFPPLRFHIGFFLALAVAALVYWFLWKTTLGFEIRTVGANPKAARYAGISVTRNTVLAMALSGALAGLAGSNEILGVNYYMAQAFSSGYGFDSIALALLGRSHPLGVVLASLLWGFLRAGAIKMQSRASIPIDIIFVIQALVIAFVAAPEMVRWLYRIPVPKETEEAIFTRGWGG